MIGEEVSFLFLESKGLCVMKDGVVGNVIFESEIANKLLEMYIDPHDSLVPELPQQLVKSIVKMWWEREFLSNGLLHVADTLY